MEDDVDIGIVPSQGLIPPTLCISDLESSKITETKQNHFFALPATRHSCPPDVTPINQVRSKVVQSKHMLTYVVTVHLIIAQSGVSDSNSETLL